ncbi:MAG: ABC transporter permease subunit [Chloroherpetonaceae bacterium]|nr:ABC transporter permease subunit [Chthonomonadaceae bacterium]MDW8209113.1 ABC transporter permease subunit [Chloroherpetonaceae bacterium]
MGRWVLDNPVLVKEMRVRMRGSRAYWILLGYLMYLGGMLLLQYGGFLSRVQAGTVGASGVSQIGQTIYQTVLWTQGFLVLLITPAITSGALTLEREQQTLDLLVLTRIPRWSIVMGKLLAAVAFVALLLFAALPLLSVAFLLGGVDPGMAVSAYLLLLPAAALVGAIGVAWSAVSRSTMQAVLYTYATLCAGIVCAFVVFGGFQEAQAGLHRGTPGENLLAAMGHVWFGRWGAGGVEGAGSVVLCLLGTGVLVTVARARLETYPERLGGALRLLTALWIGWQVLPVYLWWQDMWYQRAGRAVQVAIQPPLASLVLPAVLLMLVVPVFATGAGVPEEMWHPGRWLRRGFSWRGLRQGVLSSGLPYLLLLTGLCLLLYALPFLLTGRSGDLNRSGVAAAVSSGAAVSAVKRGDFVGAATVLLVSVAGFGLFCHFLSALCRNRWMALQLALLFLLLIWGVPALVHASTAPQEVPDVEVNLAYFNPAVAVCDLADPGTLYGRHLRWGDRWPIWQVTSALWGAVGVLSVAGMWALVRRRGLEVPVDGAVFRSAPGG